MRISNPIRHALIASIALAALASCGGSSQMASMPLAQTGAVSQSVQAPAFQNGRFHNILAMHSGIVSRQRVTTPSFMDPRAVGKPLLFVSYGDPIDIYLQGGKNKLVGQIAGADGVDLATDTAGNLYSANETYSTSSVTVYAPPYTNGPKLTLPGGTGFFGVAVSRQGTVAVAGCTIQSGSQCEWGVVFYAAGSTTPCATVLVDQAAFVALNYAAFDGKENLYIDTAGSSTQAAVIGKIDGACHAKKAMTLTTTNTFQYAGSIKVSKAGRIAILTAPSDFSVATIYSYDLPKGGRLGSPVATTPLPGAASSYAGTFAIQAGGRRIWVGQENVGPSSTPGASEFAYPTGGAPEQTVMGTPGTLTVGIAVTPPLVP